jgi:formylglycine-generating enzyme required for sulfatase activity
LVPWELEGVVLKAMARRREERYGDVRTMATDIEAFLSGRTVSAVDYTRWQLWSKFARRHWRSLAAATVVLVTILSALGYGIVVAQQQAAFERTERAKTEAQKQEAQRERTKAVAKEQEAQREREQARTNLAKAKQLGALRTISSMQRQVERQLGWTPLAYDGEELRGDLAHPPTLQRLAQAVAAIDTWQTELAVLRGRQKEFREALAAVPNADENTPAEERAWLELQRQIYQQILDGIRALDETRPLVRQWHQACQARQQQPEDAPLWSATAARIATNPLYRLGLRLGQVSVLQAQVDLVPLGPDPTSGLEEFAHLGSGTTVSRDRNERLVLEETSGIVFVLIPAGRYWIGATQETDPRAKAEEHPRHEVSLDAFFLAKHELTQAQWVALGGRNNSQLRAGQVAGHVRVTGRHPVESVSWLECVTLLGHHGLVLPTERQWEAAARGGRETPWWTGTTAGTLADAENIADASTRMLIVSAQMTERHDDGQPLTAPVGSYRRPHPLGLHDMLGNLREWCRDVFESDAYSRSLPPLDRQGCRMPQPSEEARVRTFRGGCWFDHAASARASIRFSSQPAYRDYTLGCRPSRFVISHC